MEPTQHQHKAATPEGGEANSHEGTLSAKPPAFQLMAAPMSPPIQRQGRSIRDFQAAQSSATEAEVEGTDEFQRFMDRGGPYQTQLQLSRDEARLACLLMVQAHHAGQDTDMARTGMSFAQQARARLNPQAGHGVIPRLGMEIGQVDEARAQQLFDMLAALPFWNDQGQQSPIPFHYPIDGCYARAHLMSERLTAMGYGSRKQFAIAGQPGMQAELRVQSLHAEDSMPGQKPTVRWWYHVAPIIVVSDSQGKKMDMVLDPSMATTPVTVDVWTGMMNPKKFEVLSAQEMADRMAAEPMDYGVDKQITYSTDRAAFFPDDVAANNTDSTAHRSMKAMNPVLSEYVTKDSSHKLAGEIRKGGHSTSELDSIVRFIGTMPKSERDYFKKEFVLLLLTLDQIIPSQFAAAIKDALNQ